MKNFDTQGDSTSSAKLNEYINGAPQNTIIAVVAQDSASTHFGSVKDTLKSIGGTKSSIELRSSYALLGFKGGLDPGWTIEAYNERGQGPTVIRRRISLLSGI